MFESYYVTITLSSIVTYLVWLRSKKWLRKKLESKIHSKNDMNIYRTFFLLTLIAHFALLITLVFFIDLFSFIFKK